MTVFCRLGRVMIEGSFSAAYLYTVGPESMKETFWESLPDGLDDKRGGRSWSFTLSTSLGSEEASFGATLPSV